MINKILEIERTFIHFLLPPSTFRSTIVSGFPIFHDFNRKRVTKAWLGSKECHNYLTDYRSILHEKKNEKKKNRENYSIPDGEARSTN